MENNQPQKTGFWKKIQSLSKLHILLLAGAVILVSNLAIWGIYAAYDRADDQEDRIEQQLYSNRQQTSSSSSTSQTKSSSTASSSETGSSTSATSQASSAYGIPLVETSELDGTYTAQQGKNHYHLTIQGNQGTLEKLESDGEQEREYLVFDLEKQVVYMDDDDDDDVETYTFDGSSLTLTEIDDDMFDHDQIVFTKQ